MGITDADVNFAIIPVSHSYGFSNLITPLIARGVPIALSSDPMPRAILDDLESSGATVFPGMPVFYQAFGELREVPQLNRLRLCISAGAPLSLEVARRFREKFQRPIHSFYGSSECGGICYDREAAARDAGFVGEPMKGVSLELLEPEAEASRVRVRSAAVADGYFGDLTRTNLDSGFSFLTICCRKPARDFAHRRAHFRRHQREREKVNPAEVEAALLRYEGRAAGSVFGRNQYCATRK